MRDIPGGVATGVGSMPGTDIRHAVTMSFTQTQDFPFLPELPRRGPGADLIGRGANLLVDLPVEVYAGRWQLTSRPGRDMREASDFLERDLDTVTELFSDHDGPIKIGATGAWTLAVSLVRSIGGPMLRDEGAVRELVASLTEGLTNYVANVSARLPRAKVILQLDEPSLPAVLAGDIPTESGLSRYRAVEATVVRDALSSIIAAVGVPVVVHCCASDVPVALLREAGATAVSMDLTLVDLDDSATMDLLGEQWDAGLGLFAGVVPSQPAPTETETARPVALDVAGADRIVRMWDRIGLAKSMLAEQVVVTTTCGMPAASDDYCRSALKACGETAKRITG